MRMNEEPNTLLSLSASQVSAGRDCLRLWALDRSPAKINKGPEVEEAARVGKVMHSYGEQYQKRGAMPSGEHADVFSLALPYVPAPLKGTAEGEFSFTILGCTFIGFVDNACLVQDLPPVDRMSSKHAFWTAGHLDPDMPVIIDYKGKKHIRRGQRSNVLEGPGAFYDDPQAVLYASKAFAKDKALQCVLMRWIYLQWDGRAKPTDKRKIKVFVSECVMTRRSTIEAFAAIIAPTASKLVQLRKKGTDLEPLALDPSPERCYKYGPKYACQYVNVCNLDPMDTLNTTNTGDDTMGAFLDSLNKRPKNEEPAKGLNPPADIPKTLEQGRAVLEKSAEVLVAAKQAVARHSEPPPASYDPDAELGRAVRTLFKAFKGA